MAKLTSDFAAHLVNLIEFHRDDEAEEQFPDPVTFVEPDMPGSYLFDTLEYPSALIVTLTSGAKLRVLVEGIPS